MRNLRRNFRKRFRSAVTSVMAANRMRKLLMAVREGKELPGSLLEDKAGIQEAQAATRRFVEQHPSWSQRDA